MDNLTAASFRALPDEAPLAMPTQSLRTMPPRVPRPASSPRAMWLRRFLVIGGAVALTIAGAHEMYLVLAVNGVTDSGGLHAGAVPRSVRLDRAVVHQRACRLLLAACGGRLSAGDGFQCAGAASGIPYRAADADLQRTACA